MKTYSNITNRFNQPCRRRDRISWWKKFPIKLPDRVKNEGMKKEEEAKVKVPSGNDFVLFSPNPSSSYCCNSINLLLQRCESEGRWRDVRRQCEEWKNFRDVRLPKENCFSNEIDKLFVLRLLFAQLAFAWLRLPSRRIRFCFRLNRWKIWSVMR